jgi:hypothetical protein
MRIFSFLALPLLGLGLSLPFTTACGSSGLSCENPTTTQQTCITCVNSSCGSQVSSASSDCPGSESCAAACNCGDNACIAKCGSPDAGDACVGAALDLVQCEQSMCKTQCAGVTP